MNIYMPHLPLINYRICRYNNLFTNLIRLNQLNFVLPKFTFLSCVESSKPQLYA